MTYSKKIVVKRIISPDGRLISEVKSVVIADGTRTSNSTHQTIMVRGNYSSSSSSTFISISSTSSSC